MNQPVQPEEENPYSPPRDALSIVKEEPLFPFEEDSPATMRSTYGTHEASVRTIGLYLYILGVMGVLNLALILGSPRFFQELTSRIPPHAALPAEAVKILMVFSGLFSAGFYSLLGFFLRRLQNWARWVVVIFSGFGVLGVIQTVVTVGAQFKRESIAMVIGLIFTFYVIGILLSSNNRVVLSRQYRRVVTLTPELSPRPSVRDRVFLGVAAAFYLGSLSFQLFRYS